MSNKEQFHGDASIIKPRRLNVSVRRFDAPDLETALAIERHAGGSTWSRSEFLVYATEHWIVGLSARAFGNQCVGYAFYEINKTHLQLNKLAVAQQYRLRGVGRRLLDEVIQRALKEQRERIDAYVWERSVEGQLLLRSAGFKMTRVCRGYYCDFDPCAGDAAYLFTWRPPAHA